MKILKSFKADTREERIYVLPETEEEAQRLGQLAKTGHYHCQMAACVYEHDNIREQGQVLVIRFLPVISKVELEHLVKTAASKFVNVSELYSTRPKDAKITYAAPLDRDYW